jgi:aminomethyltransferase
MVARIVGESILQLKRFQFRDDIIWDDVRIKCSRTGYTGEDGFEIFSAPDAALALWSALTVLGAAPCGLASRDVLRLEAAYPLYGQELDNMHKPAESGVGWAVKSKKGEFIGREALVTGSPTEEHSTLIGLKMTDPQNAIVRVGFSVMDKQNNGRIGEITSGTLSPTVGHGIALARVERRYASLGESLLVDIRGRKAVAEVTPLPFYRNGV